MNVGRVVLAVSLCAASTLGIASGCSAEPGERRPPGVAARLPPPIGAAGASTPSSSSGEPPFDVETFTPLLAMPELRAAMTALDGSDAGAAVREVSRAMAEKPPDASLVRSYQFL